MTLKSLLIAFCGFSTAFLANEEFDVLLSSLKHLQIRNCIFAISTDLNVTHIKKLNLNYIITGHMAPEMLEKYITETNPPDAAVSVVMKNKSYVENVFLKKYESLDWFIWFLITNDDLDGVDIPASCQFFQIKKGVNRNYRLIETYKLKDTFIAEDFGVWSHKGGLNASSLSWYGRRKNFRGIVLKVKLCKKYKITMSVMEFFDDTARILNFTSGDGFSIQRDLKYVNEDIISDKYSGTNQEASTCLWAITGQEKEKDWVFLYFGIKIGIITKFRGTNEIGWAAYLTPFAKDMWVAIFLWLVISTVSVIIVRGCSRLTVYINILTAFFCLCNTDPMVMHPPNDCLSLSTKLVYLMVLLVPCVIIPAYSGYILSTLSCVLPLIPFTDFKSFIADGSFKLTAPTNSFGSRFLRESNDSDLKFIYKNFFQRTSRSFEEMFENLCKDGKLVGLFPDSKAIQPLFKCKMYIIPIRVTTISTGILLPNKTLLRKFFNKRFRQHSEKGLKYDIVRSPFVVTNRFEEETESLNSLNMSQMKAIFLLVFFGVILSLIILIIEIAVKKHGQVKLSKTKRSTI